MPTAAQLDLTLTRADTGYHLRMRFYAANQDVLQEATFPATIDPNALLPLQLDPEQYGQTLYTQVFADRDAEKFLAACRATAMGIPLRLRLCVASDALELNHLRWELLRTSQGEPLTTGDHVWFSRYLVSEEARTRGLRPRTELRALVAIANPNVPPASSGDKPKFAPIDVAQEEERIRQAWGDDSSITFMNASKEHITLANFIRRLRDGYDVVYLIAHGQMTRDKSDSVLLLEDEAGNLARTRGAELLAALDDIGQWPRLWVLLSCQSAHADEISALQALGPQLSVKGLPAVMAMQGDFSMATSAHFMPEFFRELRQHGQIDHACAVARSVVRGQVDAWMPALFLRAESGRLWLPLDETTGNLVQGFGQLSTAYNSRVQSFLEHYLGTSEHPAPFGGRPETLQELNRWLTGEHMPRYALLNAPAGRGKSLLLAQWVTLVMDAHQHHIIYFPISARFNTHLENVVFAALAARAAHLYGAKVPLTGDAQQYRGLFADLLREPAKDRKPILVVVDGLDEAEGWEWGPDIFPAHAPAHLRVLVTTRPLAGDVSDNDWLSRLGWRGAEAYCLSLPALTEAGVREMLTNMGPGLAAVAAQVDVVTALHRLSEGDPLLVRLYVETLFPQGQVSATFKVDDLQNLKPGLKAYFDLQYKDLRARWKSSGELIDEEAVDVFFEVCAFALGPLAKEDIIALTAPLLDASRKIRRLESAISSFVIGNGTPKNGYVFSHPRLGEYFAGELTRAEQARWRAQFMAYVTQTLQALQSHTLTPTEASAYAVQYYIAHWRQAKAPLSSLYALVCGEWAQAWYALDDSYTGFLNDLQTVWASAVAERAVGILVRCALFQTSLAALSSNIAPELLAVAMANRLLSLRQGLLHVKSVTDFKAADERLQAIALQLGVEQLKEAFALGQTLGGWLPLWGPSLLGQMALEPDGEDAKQLRAKNIAELLPTGVIDVGLKLLAELPDETKAVIYLGLVQCCLPTEKANMALGAWEIARTIPDVEARITILTALAHHLPATERAEALTSALAVVLQDEEPRVNILTKLAPHLPAAESAKAWAAAFAAARAIQDEGPRVNTLTSLAPQLPPTERAEALMTALATAHAIQDEKHRVSALTALAPHLPPAESTEALKAAFVAAQAIQDESYRAMALMALVPHLPPAERAEALTAAFAVARAIQDENDRATALMALAPHLLPAENTEALTIAFAAARVIQNEKHRAITLTALAPHLSPTDRAEAWAAALKAARAIRDEEPRINALTRLAHYLPPTERTQALMAALDDARTIQDEGLQVNALVALAPYLSPQTSAEVLPTALAAARAIQDEEHRADALIKLAPHLPAELLSDAIAAARTIQDERHCAAALTAVASYLPSAERAEALTAALTVVHAIQDEERRADALTKLAPHLPPTERAEALAIALAAAHAIPDEEHRADALVALAPYLPSVERAEALTIALAAARTIPDAGPRINTLIKLAPHLSSAERAEALTIALAAARTIQDEGPRVNALTALALHLPPKLLPIALTAARAIGNEESRAKALAALALHLPPELFPAALAAARAIQNEKHRAKALAALAPHLPPELLSDALTAAGAIQNEGHRASTLAALVPYLPPDLRSAAFVAARAVQNTRARVTVFTALVPYLPPVERAEALTSAHAAAHALSNEESRAKALAALAPHLPLELLPATLSAVYTLQDAESVIAALTTLASPLPLMERAEVLTAALAAARAIQNTDTRLHALTGLLASLTETEHVIPAHVPAVYSGWHTVLNELSRFSRPVFLEHFPKLLPLTLKLVPETERSALAGEIARAMLDVSQAWP